MPASPGSRPQRSAHIAPARSSKARGATANIPNMIRRKKRFRWPKALYRERNHVERFFNKLKHFRRIATCYDKLGANFLAFIQLAAVRISLRSIEPTT
jgi:transposase